MFLLAQAWGLGVWGRWFAGLTFPLCGFLVGWLLYPGDQRRGLAALDVARHAGGLARPHPAPGGRAGSGRRRDLAWGHVQTAAHVLLAVGAYVVWLTLRDRQVGRPVAIWVGGVACGIGLAAIEVGPLAAYLTRSPVWGDRDLERVAPWRLVRPRLLEAVCTALPSLYGSQRRGEPNLARAIGADNQNESAGGYVPGWQRWSCSRRWPGPPGATILGSGSCSG